MSPTPPKMRKPAPPRPPRKPSKPGVKRKSDPTPDPLADVEYIGNVETDSAAELTALQKAYRERAKNEADRFVETTDSEYWCCVCFENREERERFMKAIREHPNTKYITGERLAAALGITY